MPAKMMVADKDFGIGYMGDILKQAMNRKTAKNIVILIGMNLIFILKGDKTPTSIGGE